MIPRNIVSNVEEGVLHWEGQETYTSLSVNLIKPYLISGYSPKNKKLLCYPYTYLILDNNNGTSNKLDFERFLNSTIEFSIEGIPVPRWINKMYSNRL